MNYNSKFWYERRSSQEEIIKLRAEELAKYIIETGDTIRGTARNFGISKSTVHKDVTCRLESAILVEGVRAVLDKNKAERHIRGGMATKRKYCSKKLV